MGLRISPSNCSAAAFGSGAATNARTTPTDHHTWLHSTHVLEVNVTRKHWDDDSGVGRSATVLRPFEPGNPQSVDHDHLGTDQSNEI